MNRNGLIFAVVLMLLGVGGYFGTGRQSVTALIPTFFGVAVFLALKLAPAKGMGISAILALLGIGGTARALPAFLDYIGGGELERPAAVQVQVAMLVACVLFLVTWFLGRRAGK